MAVWVFAGAKSQTDLAADSLSDILPNERKYYQANEADGLLRTLAGDVLLLPVWNLYGGIVKKPISWKS